MQDFEPVSLWDASAAEDAQGADHIEFPTADIAVVGGGYTGLSTALHGAEKGLKIQVIEAQKIGYGGSGRNVGLVNAGSWLAPEKVIGALGPEYGPRFLRLFGAAPAYVFDLIEKHQMRCEATRTGTIHAAHARSGLRDLERRHDQWRRLDAPVELLNRDEMQRKTGTRAFLGGLLDRRAGTINPMGYCRGLLRAAAAAGARTATGVRATGLKRDGAGWTVDTTRGQVTARRVVLATNAYTDDLWPGLSRVFTPINYFQFATAPLGDEAAHILPGGQGLWDTGTIMFNYRRDAFGRLLIGSMGSVLGSVDRGLSRRWANRRIARIFPDLGAVEFEQAWHGQIAMTADHIPRILELDEGLFTPIGYNGRGITTGTVFGKAMAELLTGAPRDALPLPVTRPEPAPRAGLAARAYQTAFTANQIWKSF